MRTVWAWIPGFEGRYEVSDAAVVRGVCRTSRRRDGRITTVRGRIISPSVAKNGYLRVNLNTPEGPKRYKSLLLHRIVALAFLPTEDTDLEVNHKDGDKTNCAAKNLEWVNRAENVQHSHDTGLHPATIRVVAKNCNTGEVFTYPSVASAVRELVNPESKRRVYEAVRNGQEAFGYLWAEHPA